MLKGRPWPRNLGYQQVCLEFFVCLHFVSCLFTFLPDGASAKDEGKPANMKDVDVQDPDGKTGMMLAGANGHLNVVEYLAKKGAKIDAIDNEGFTALMMSAVNRHRPVVEYLLSQKADVTLQCKYGTALDIMLDLYN